MPSLNRPLTILAALAALTLGPAALAGPPLICHPFMTGTDAQLLPWADGNHWHLPDRAYDRTNLVADTLNLLTADAPILERMENMRRAAIYADENPAVAAALLGAVVDRTTSKPADARAEALEWFDAGYLVETYRQLGVARRHEMLPARESRTTSLAPELEALDGYAVVRKAAALAPEALAELEFALALIVSEPLTSTHLRRAAAGAAADSLLAQNLVHYDLH